MKLKKTIYNLVLILLFGCAQKQAQEVSQYSELIKGDWVNNSDESGLVFSFKDSTCSYLYPWGQLSPYKINEDTLLIKEQVRRRSTYSSGGNEDYIFLVDSLTNAV